MAQGQTMSLQDEQALAARLTDGRIAIMQREDGVRVMKAVRAPDDPPTFHPGINHLMGRLPARLTVSPY